MEPQEDFPNKTKMTFFTFLAGFLTGFIVCFFIADTSASEILTNMNPRFDYIDRDPTPKDK